MRMLNTKGWVKFEKKNHHEYGVWLDKILCGRKKHHETDHMLLHLAYL